MQLGRVSTGVMMHRFTRATWYTWRVRPLLVALVLLVPGCLRVQVPRPQEGAAGRLLRELAARLQSGRYEPLAVLFTPECRASCTGFVPTPTRLGSPRVEGQWWPRLVAGTLVGDLLLARRSYARLDRLELVLVELRGYALETALRVRLLAVGRDPSGRPLRDQGELDLRLRETGAGLRIARLAPRRVRRVVTLLPEERALAATPSSRPARAEESPAEPASEPAAAGDEREPATAGDEREPAEEGLAPARPRLGELEVRRGGKLVTLQTLAGARATLLALERGAPAAARCEELAREARARRGVNAAILLLDGGGAHGRGCALPVVRATPRTRRALEWLRPLLPALVLLDGEGAVRRVAGAGAGQLGLLESLDRL